MFQIHYKKRLFPTYCIFAIIVFCILFFQSIEVQAAKVEYFSYEDVKDNMLEKYQTSEFIHISAEGAPCIAFATYNGSNYSTSVKRLKDTNDYLYCVNYQKSINYDSSYGAKNDLFNNTLKGKLAVAFFNGPKVWGGYANSEFTTNNFIADYYMTQIVVHSLIYKYGNKKSSYGIDFDKITFKNPDSKLAKNTKIFYEYCCNVDINTDTGDSKSYEFSFINPGESYLYLESDTLVSPTVSCYTNPNNGEVNAFSIMATVSGIEGITALERDSNSYNSSFRVKVPLDRVAGLSPGAYLVEVSENVFFSAYHTRFWQSTDEDHASQEVGKEYPENVEVSDKIAFKFLVGEIVLHKKDSVTGENIKDAEFQLLQYDDTRGEYVYYKDLEYSTDRQEYYCNSIYVWSSNKSNKFKVIESKAGEHYLNDWSGAEFQLTEQNTSFIFDVENQPVLGKLKIKKNGEGVVFTNSSFTKQNEIALSGIKFGLYAKEDISVKQKLLYPKDKKIADMITDKNGEIKVDNLVPGNYYFKEEETNDAYQLDSRQYSFSITQDENGKYSEVSYQIKNMLKRCQIKLFKYYYAKEDTKQDKKIAVKGAKFGLYAKKDIVTANGICILKKDSIINEAISDEEGTIVFDNLPWGEYYVKELEAPKDFILDDTITTISLKDFKLNSADNIYVANKDIMNQKQNFQIEILKYGEILSGFTTEKNDVGEYISYQLENKPLKDVEFALYNEKEALLDITHTDQNGVAVFSGLESGKYYAMEISSPEAYLMDTSKVWFSCESNGKVYNPLKPPVFSESVYNQLFTCTIQLHKSGECFKINESGAYYDKIPLENVVFGIYQDFDYQINQTDKKVVKESCVGYIVTDANGDGNFSAKLPDGTYYLKELQTNAGYQIDSTPHTFEIRANQNNNIEIQYTGDKELTNELLKAAVQVIKTDSESNKALKDVEFTLYNEKEEKIGVYKTDKEGKILVENLPYGNYYFIETKCKNGYYSSNNKYYFTLETPELVTLNITNTPILKLGFEEHYKIGLIICFLLVTCFVSYYFIIIHHRKKAYRKNKEIGRQ